MVAETDQVMIPAIGQARQAEQGSLASLRQRVRHACASGGSDSLLPIGLAAAVPLWIATLRERCRVDDLERRTELAHLLAEHGDDILYRSGKPGDTARAFNALAESIAILSFAPGGVHAFDTHWVSAHPGPRHDPCAATPEIGINPMPTGPAPATALANGAPSEVGPGECPQPV